MNPDPRPDVPEPGEPGDEARATSPGVPGSVAASPLVIVGMMGSGKTTLGRALAERLQRPLLDSDAEIERRRGISGAEIADLEGVEILHALERSVLLEALRDPSPLVVTAAASVVTDAECRRAMVSAIVIWLDAPVDALVARVASGAHRRPIDVEAAERLALERREAFVEIADLRLDALRPPGELVDAAFAHLATVR